MSMNDPLAAALSKLRNAEKVSKRECLMKPVSKVVQKVLDILNEKGYVGKYEIKDDGKGGYILLNLLNAINKCGVVKPRFAVTLDDYEKFEKRFLPAKDFGILIISTSQGMMTHYEAKEKKIGGKLIAYCY
ncbi:30S ribosomal protein S8 [Candidatus Woesearchaeota archaeon]|jgi:small subunit ribosomal protein S8|nr:30S ribosomal protein S8 [Candidatus Woesearchaeota archaeon]